MYPSVEVLQELGRVTIAGSRLDWEVSQLWWHLDPTGVDAEQARRESGSKQSKSIRRLAASQLYGGLQARVIQVADDADAVRRRRNDVVHQDWVLRSLEGMRPVAEVVGLDEQELEEWRREPTPSQGWLRLPSRSLDLVPAQTLDELRDVERQLSAVGARVVELTFEVASARETGCPEGYLRPAGPPSGG